MNNLTELVTSSVLARALALLVLALALLAAILVAALDFLSGKNPPVEIINFLYFGLGAALTITGVNFGVVLQPAPKPLHSTQEVSSGTATANS